MIATYHNHTSWSDGKAAMADLVARARELGVEELGVSDHFVLHPSGTTPRWSMDPGRLPEYVAEVLSFRGADGPAIRLGLEVDWFPEVEDRLRATLASIPLDFVIGSVHEVDGFRVDASAETWNRLSPEDQQAMHQRYWARIAEMARSGLYDIAAHLDLPKKFGHRPAEEPTHEIGLALDAIAEAGMVVELNTSGWHKPCRDGYPTLDILKECRARDIRVMIGADAHDPDHLLRDFPRAAQRLAKAGYEEVARFDGRKATYEHLEAAVARF